MGIKTAAVQGLRKVPMPVAEPIVRRRISRMRSDEVTRDVARGEMEFLLGAARPDADLDEAAARHLEHRAWRAELRWRVKHVTKQRAVGIDNLHRVRGGTDGLIVAFLHHGQYDSQWIKMMEAGAPESLVGVVHPRFYDDDIPVFIKQHLALIEMAATTVPATIGFKGMAGLLGEGKSLVVAVDVPGRTPVDFVGRRVAVSSGAAGLAFATGTPVVCVTCHPAEGLVQEVRVSEAMLPSDHADPESMLQAIFDRFEPGVLAWPEAYDWPRSKFTLLDDDGTPVPHVPAPGEPSL